MNNEIDKLSEARKAFNLLDAAIRQAHAATRCLEQSQIPKTTAMLLVPPPFFSSRTQFRCASCQYEFYDRNPAWKFCPSCGAEIMRWEQPAEDKGRINVFVETLEPEKPEYRVVRGRQANSVEK